MKPLTFVLQIPRLRRRAVELYSRDTPFKSRAEKSKIVYKDLPLDDPRQRKPDITRAKEVLKWTPKIELEQGVSQTIDYFKSVLN